MATKKVPSSMVAKQTAKVKQVKKISGSASGTAPKPSNNMLKGAKAGAVGRYAKNASVEEAFKFLGKAAKANVSMPGRTIKDVKKTVSKAAKGFAKGYKGK